MNCILFEHLYGGLGSASRPAENGSVPGLKHCKIDHSINGSYGTSKKTDFYRCDEEQILYPQVKMDALTYL